VGDFRNYEGVYESGGLGIRYIHNLNIRERRNKSCWRLQEKLKILCSYSPNFHSKHVEFGAFIAQWLVTKCLTGTADALFEGIIQPETVVAIARRDG
jgi:hypothetical protein